MTRRAAAVLAAAVVLAAAPACERAQQPPIGETPGTGTAPPGPLAREDTLLTAVVQRQPEGGYVLQGHTGAADALQLSVEDGHFILYGPAEVPVGEDGRFRVAFELEPTELPTVYLYLVDAGGTSQWVIPVPLHADRVEWGPGSERLPDRGP